MQFPTNLHSLTFGNHFDQNLDDVKWPDALRSLTFGSGFDQSLDGVKLPCNLQHLTFGILFSQCLARVRLPNLQSLTFVETNVFDQSLECVNLPKTLQSLTFGMKFNHSLERVHLPDALQRLTFGMGFDQSMERVTLPRELQSLTFGSFFQQPLDRVTWPTGLRHLTFGVMFNQSLVNVTLPPQLQSLTFGQDFNQNLEGVKLPSSLSLQRLSGSCAEFRHQWQEALPETRLLGRWLCGRDARWIGGLQETSTHEVRYILKAQRVVLLLSPEPSAALTFTEFRKALEGWTEPDDVMCVPICGAPFDRHASALHTIVAPSEEFPSIQAALDAVPFDEPLHRVLLRQGSYEVSTLEIQRPAGSNGTCHGAAAVEIRTEGEPTIVGCRLYAEGPWGSCISAYGGSPQILRNFVSCARWGLVLVQTAGRVEDNSIRGLGEAGVVLVGGSTFIHRNSFSDCGGPAILAVSDCCAVLQKNDVRDCLSGVKVMGKRSEIQMRTGNRLLHNGIMDEHQPGSKHLQASSPLVPRRRSNPAGGKSAAWDGPGAGYGEQCVAVLPGTMCEVLRRGPQGWLLVWTSGNQRGWCSPHVFG
eukprot:g14932.t1